MDDDVDHRSVEDSDEEQENGDDDERSSMHKYLRGRTNTPPTCSRLQRSVRDSCSGDENDLSQQSSRESSSSPMKPATRRRNWEKQCRDNSSRPLKSFEDFVAEEKDRREKLEIEKKTMEQFLYKSPPRRDARSKKYSLYLAIAILGICILFVGYPLFGGYHNDNSQESTTSTKLDKSWEDMQNKLLQDSRKIRKLFPLQSDETRIHLLAAINSSLSRKEPKQPSSVTLLIPPTMKKTNFPLCFAQTYAKLTNKLFSLLRQDPVVPSPFFIDLKYFQKYGEDITGIHTQVDKYFASGGKAVVVQDVEMLQENKHLQIFHWLCDNFKAPDKRATIFFTIPVPQKIFTNYDWKNEHASKISFDVLNTAWSSSLSDDSRPAFISRVAATVVLLNEGDSC